MSTANEKDSELRHRGEKAKNRSSSKVEILDEKGDIVGSLGGSPPNNQSSSSSKGGPADNSDPNQKGPKKAPKKNEWKLFSVSNFVVLLILMYAGTVCKNFWNICYPDFPELDDDGKKIAMSGNAVLS